MNLLTVVKEIGGNLNLMTRIDFLVDSFMKEQQIVSNYRKQVKSIVLNASKSNEDGFSGDSLFSNSIDYSIKRNAYLKNYFSIFNQL